MKTAHTPTFLLTKEELLNQDLNPIVPSTVSARVRALTILRVMICRENPEDLSTIQIDTINRGIQTIEKTVTSQKVWVDPINEFGWLGTTVVQAKPLDDKEKAIITQVLTLGRLLGLQFIKDTLQDGRQYEARFNIALGIIFPIGWNECEAIQRTWKYYPAGHLAALPAPLRLLTPSVEAYERQNHINW